MKLAPNDPMAPTFKYCRTVSLSWLLISGLLVSSASAQAGGGLDSLFRFDGSSPNTTLGTTVAGVGDINADGFPDFLAGIPSASPNGFLGAGSVQVFSGADGSIIRQLDGTLAGHRFGYSVSAMTDLNGDGVGELLIGSPGAVLGSTPSYGEVFVYSGASGFLLFHAQGPGSYDSFGYCVADAGDIDGDGLHDFIVGAPAADVGFLAAAGSAFVYSGANGNLLLRLDGNSLYSNFGLAVDGVGDVNADGLADLIVGSPSSHPANIPSAGRAIVFSGVDGSELHQYVGGTFFERLGTTVAGIGDIDGDGSGDYLIGSPGLPVTGVGNLVGGVLVCTGASGAVMQHVLGEAEGSSLGSALGAAGDVDGDGTPDYLLGAPQGNPGDVGMAGSAFLYSGATRSLLQRFDGLDPFEHTGWALSSAGDIDGDGRSEVLVGAPFASVSGPYTYEGFILVLRWNPYMVSDAHAISVVAGGQVNLEIDFPAAAASYSYKVLMSVTGNGPMTFGVDLPLSEDFLVRSSYFGIYPFRNYSNLHGTLSSLGDASASISIAAGQLDPSLVGRTIWMAAAASPSGLKPAEYSSVAVEVQVTP